MMKNVFLNVCVLLLCSFPFHSFALENDPLPVDSLIRLKEVVVSATKTEVSRDQIPLTISVVNRATLEESTETGVLSILSKEVPGLFVTERSVTGYGINNGSAGTVSIHGVGGGNKVLMLFDGQPMWAGVFGHSIADAFVASDAERVEVIRGPGSLLYGSNAMGGVINVITRQAKEDGLKGKVRVMYGSYNTQKYSANAGLKKDKLNLYASINHDRSDGQRDNSKFYITNGYIRGGYTFSDYWNASADAIIADFKINNPGTIEVPAIENWAKALRSTYSASLSNKYENMSGSLQLYYNIGKHKIDDGWRNGEPRDYWFRSKDFVRGLALFESFNLFDGNQFTVGIDAKQWGGHAWNQSKPGKDADGEIMDNKVTEVAGYVTAQQTLFDHLTINAGVRLENNSGYGNEWVPQAGLAYQLNNSTIKASASKGFRSPNINEMYAPWGAVNPDLEPEEMWNYDISYLQSFLNDQLHFEITAYLAKGSNMVVAGQNTGKFENKGIDFGLNFRILPSLRVNTNYSFLDSDAKFTAAPKHKAYLGIDWKISNKFSINPNFQYVDDLYVRVAENNDVLESYALLNCKVSYKPIDRITLFVNGENLTDTSYQNLYGYPMPGIVVLGGIDVKF